MNAKVIGGVVIGAVLVAGGLYYYRMQQEAAKWKNAKEIVEATFNKEGSVATIHFVSVVEGPLDKVQEAVWAVERSAQMVENIRKSELVKQEGNTKTVDMQLQALNLPLQQYVMQFTLDPAAHRVRFKTIEAQAADLEGSYQLTASPDGRLTQIVYEAKSTDKIAIPFPSSVIESANRETFVNTIRGVKKALKAPPAG